MRAIQAAVLVATAAVARSASAKTHEARVLSLEDAVALAEASSEDVAVARAGVDRADAQTLRARSELLPQITASASYDRLIKSEYEGLFGSEGGSESGNTSGANPAPAAVDFSRLPFGRRNTYRIGVSASQPVFAGGRLLADQRMAQATRQNAAVSVSSTRAQAVLQVASAYFDAVLADQLLAIAVASLAQAERVAAQTRLARSVGNQAEFDELRADVAAQNQRPQVVSSRAERDRAYLRLAQLLDVPEQTPLHLTTSLGDEDLRDVSPAARAAARVDPGARKPRAPVRQAQAAVAIRQAALDSARAQRWPSLSLTSQYGRVAYPTDVLPGAWNEFRTNFTVGLVLQWSLFTSGRVTGDVRSARADLDEARARLRQTEELVALDNATSAQQVDAARAQFDATAGTTAQATRAYEIAEVRQREGVSTLVELSDARLALAQARVNRAQAAREWQVARVRLALLSELPLATGASVPPSQGQGAPASSAQGAAQGAAAAQQMANPTQSPTAPVVGQQVR